MSSSAVLLANIPRRLDGSAPQALTDAYLGLLAGLGHPEQKLPPVFHVAGTNGKGSTCAFLRSILEAAGYKVHVYTSPHLVHVHERIRIAGKLIDEDELAQHLRECMKRDDGQQVSEFEILTAAAFAAFNRHPADFTILETGLGGRLDATNVVRKPLATLITRLSYDHRDFLGDTIEKIAYEKAGIMKEAVPCFASAQPDAEATQTLDAVAAKICVKLFKGGIDWRVRAVPQGFHFRDAIHEFDLPLPALTGMHQLENASLAIAALSVLPKPVTREIIAKGLLTVQWPARLQSIKQSVWARFLAENQELWLDGGHNDSAGEVLSKQAEIWREEDGQNPRPLFLVYGMLKTKQPQEFLRALAPFIAGVRTIEIPDELKTFAPDELAVQTRRSGIKDVQPSASLEKALKELSALSPCARILICGSLYLAGYVLRKMQLAKHCS